MKRKAEWETCPLCLTATDKAPAENKIQWIACDAKQCGKWYHCSCLDIRPNAVDAYYCADCTTRGLGATKWKKERPKRAKSGVDYTALDAGEHVNALRHAYTTLIESRSFAKQDLLTLPGSELRKSYFDEHGFDRPIYVREGDLEMRIPDLTVAQVSDIIGHDKRLEVMDVPTQGEDRGWTLGRWAAYYDSTPDRVRNVISLEVTDTPLDAMIQRPKIVREMDLLQYWPADLADDRPKVQNYCLMSLQNSYTDFHIDFAGTSVYYHIVQGAKTFLFIPPTPANLNKYTEWCKSANQSKTFLADQCKETFKVELVKGDTMLIPSGWIHAVHTPEKALVIGGNFLHLHGMVNHIKVVDIEVTTKVPGKFRFPQFERTLWFAIIHMLARRIKPCQKEEAGALALAEFAIQDASIHIHRRKELPVKGNLIDVAYLYLQFITGAKVKLKSDPQVQIDGEWIDLVEKTSPIKTEAIDEYNNYLPPIMALSKPESRHRSGRCTRCAKDKKMCDRSEPMCSRCKVKGFSKDECHYL